MNNLLTNLNKLNKSTSTYPKSLSTTTFSHSGIRATSTLKRMLTNLMTFSLKWPNLTTNKLLTQGTRSTRNKKIFLHKIYSKLLSPYSKKIALKIIYSKLSFLIITASKMESSTLKICKTVFPKALKNSACKKFNTLHLKFN